MLFAVFIIFVVLWVVAGSLHNLLAHQLSGQIGSRAQTLLLRSLDGVRPGLHLVYWLLTVLVLVEAGRQFGYLGVVWGMVFIVTMAGLGYFAINQPSVQQQILKLVSNIAAKWGTHLSFIGKLLRKFEPLAKKMFREQPLYRDREGLLSLLRREHQMHKAFSPSQHRQLENMLKVDSETVAPFVVALKEAKMVKADDTVGPLLLTELHDSPRGAFPVYGKRRANIVGILEQGVAVSHAKGNSKVTRLMDERIVFLPQNASLAQALQTFTETSSALSVIIDENNTPTGVLYIQDIVRELFGDLEEKSNENTDQPAR